MTATPDEVSYFLDSLVTTMAAYEQKHGRRMDSVFVPVRILRAIKRTKRGMVRRRWLIVNGVRLRIIKF